MEFKFFTVRIARAICHNTALPLQISPCCVPLTTPGSFLFRYRVTFPRLIVTYFFTAWHEHAGEPGSCAKSY